MPSSRLTAGVRTGLLASATTAGVIVGYGLREDSALAPFLIAGRATIAATTGLVASAGFATVFGIVLHTAWMLLWGICFSVVATPLRRTRSIVAALVFTAVVGLLARTVAPGALGAGAMAARSPAQTLLLLLLFGTSLLLGMRIARA